MQVHVGWLAGPCMQEKNKSTKTQDQSPASEPTTLIASRECC